MYANEAADKLAGAGAQMEAVEDIIVPVSGAMTNLMICMRGNRRYVSHSVRAEGFRQAQVRPLVWKLVISQCCGKTYIHPRKW